MRANIGLKDRPYVVVLPIVRCFAERKDDQWQAFSLEFGLAAQADSLGEVRAKLESMIESYVHEALTDDRAHAKALLSRKGTWRVYLKFYCYCLLSILRHARGTFDIFNEALPVDARVCPT
jgi:hypothetical protein